MTPTTSDAVLTWPAFDEHEVDVAVTTRAGGVSTGPYATLNLGLHVGDDPAAVVENRRRAAALVGAALDDLVFCNQAHGRNVVVVGEAERGRGTRSLDDAIPAADAMVTTTPGLVLVVMVADCVPIVLFDPAARVLAVVHAGWRGTVARVAAAAVEAMESLGASPARIVAGVGPAVAAERYQVGPEVADAAAGLDGLRPDGTGRWTFDLWAANGQVLREAGVDPAAIHVAPVATGPGSPFFSDRAERPCGRFAALARLRPSS